MTKCVNCEQPTSESELSALAAEGHAVSCPVRPKRPVVVEIGDDDPPSLQPTVSDDVVNHPSHYTWHPSGVEAADILEGFPYNKGAVIKYVWRSGYKGEGATAELQDLRKAMWYLRREIHRIEKMEKQKGKTI